MTEDRRDDAELDPAVALEQLANRSEYPPGFYGTIRHRLPFFALVGALSILLSLIPFPHQHTKEVLVAGGVFFALTAAAIVLPWSRIPQWVWSVIPIGYIGVIALIRDAQGSGAGIVVLYLLPIAWLAFYGRRAPVIAGILAVTLALVLPIVLEGGSQYPTTQWRLVLVTTAMSSLLAFSFLTMVGRDRRYVADLAIQSRLAGRHAIQAVQAREQLDSILQAATETAIIGTDGEGMVTFFSAGAEGLLGYTADEVAYRMDIFQLLDRTEVTARRGAIDTLVEAAKLGTSPPVPVQDTIWTYVRKDGIARRAAVTLHSRPGDDGLEGYVAVAIDVTEREQLAFERERLLVVQREVTEVLAEQNRRLRELTQMKDDVVATVSHELRTPLTSIRGFVELLLETPSTSLDAEQERMLRTIDRNSMQLLRVAEDLLADPGGSHSLRVHFLQTNLSEIASDAVDTLAAQAANRRIRLTLECDSGVVVHGDPDRIHQLLSNLLSNAVKFTRIAGRVMVRVDQVGQFARIDVLDDGPGVPKEDRKQLFERFYRLASTHHQGIPGSGLGLAIAKTVVEAHDGTIDIVDTPGWSTTFRVLLPMSGRDGERLDFTGHPIGVMTDENLEDPDALDQLIAHTQRWADQTAVMGAPPTAAMPEDTDDGPPRLEPAISRVNGGPGRNGSGGDSASSSDSSDSSGASRANGANGANGAKESNRVEDGNGSNDQRTASNSRA